MATAPTERMATARRALERAEAATGLRTRLTAPLRLADDDVAGPVGDDGGREQDATRSVPDDAVCVVTASPGPGRRGGVVTGSAAGTGLGRAPATGPLLVGGTVADHLPVPAVLAGFFPAAGLRRGSVVQVGGSSALLLAILAGAQGEGWVALAALPDVGLQAAAEAGLALERSLLVPRPGPEAAAVVGALVDGVDMLAVGDCRALNARDRRLLSARLRSRGAVLLSTAHWPGADVVLRAGQAHAGGLGRGWGRLETREMTVHGRGRSGVDGRVRVRCDADGLSALSDGGLSAARDDEVSALRDVAVGDAPSPAPAEQSAGSVSEPARSRLQAVS